ncbi:MAG: YggT family protein [Candidatus Dormibacteraeota bacterium]|nr:YggT family protein [Candidatus Dormibacteraeota bacterium]
MSHEMIRIVSAVIQVVILLIVARAVGSFFVRDWSRGIPRFLWDVTEPILSPVRRILPPMGGLDFSPLVLIIGLQLLNGFIAGL